jgi:hypothetical protein
MPNNPYGKLMGQWTREDEIEYTHNTYPVFQKPTPGQLTVLLTEVNKARYESIDWLCEHFDIDSYLTTRNSVQHLINFFKGERGT